MLRSHSAKVQNAPERRSGQEAPVNEWDDIRHFLAVARGGSTLAAARALKVSQTTTARRVAALEARLGAALFERRQAGYALTEAGAALLPQAEAVAAAAGAFDLAAGALARDAGGTVRLSAGTLFAITILPPLLRDLHDAHPGVRIELDTSDELRDLAAGEADVALRTVEQPTGAGLVGRVVAPGDWAVYCSHGYAEAHGRPHRRAELRGHAFIGGGEPKIWRIYQAWLAENGLEDAVTMHLGSSAGLLSAVRAGAGLAALPCLVADREPELIRCLPPSPHVPSGALWLLTHERVRHAPRVRTVLDFLGPRLAGLARV